MLALNTVSPQQLRQADSPAASHQTTAARVIMLVSSSIWQVISPVAGAQRFCSANSSARFHRQSPSEWCSTHRDDSARITIDTSPIGPLILSST